MAEVAQKQDKKENKLYHAYIKMLQLLSGHDESLTPKELSYGCHFLYDSFNLVSEHINRIIKFCDIQMQYNDYSYKSMSLFRGLKAYFMVKNISWEFDCNIASFNKDEKKAFKKIDKDLLKLIESIKQNDEKQVIQKTLKNLSISFASYVVRSTIFYKNISYALQNCCDQIDKYNIYLIEYTEMVLKHTKYLQSKLLYSKKATSELNKLFLALSDSLNNETNLHSNEQNLNS